MQYLDLEDKRSEKEICRAAISRYRCFLFLQSIRSQFKNLSPDTLIAVAINGHYAFGHDVFEAGDHFREKYPAESPDHFIRVGKVI